jgi:16S rRNA (uracil1498-N3)-methyltransferase
VELVNGQGALAKARIRDLDKQLAALEILSSTHFHRPASISLAVPLMRPAKLEWVVEKGTELGADAFIFYRADLSEKDSLSEHQIERLRHLSISALKQSGRLYLPSFEVAASLVPLFSRDARFLFGDVRPAEPLTPEPTTRPTIFVTGPEKGFSPSELALLEKRAKGVRVNPNILRAETAPIAALSILANI